jgi:3-oxoacyl-[acyl-carrier protein] reductase
MSAATETVDPAHPDPTGRVAVVTGGSRGIGAETARTFAARGAAVAVIARDQGPLESVAAAIRAGGGRALAVAADCTVEADLEQVAKTVADQLGPVEIVAAFAGGNGMPVPTAEENAAHWRKVIELNLTSTFITVNAFLPAMLARGRGAIVTMSSSAGRQAAQSSIAYAAAKAGVVGFTRHLASEVASHGIRVNCLAPAAIENDRMRAWMTQEQRDQLGASFPLGRIGQPADVASAALFLASDAASWITGVTLDVAGGKVMV